LMRFVQGVHTLRIVEVEVTELHGERPGA
jgi:hypothetical protein